MSFRVMAVLGAMMAAACKPPSPQAGGDRPLASDGRENKAAFGDWGVETRYLSDTVAPGDDFFTYANQGWLQTAQRPAGYARFTEMNAMFLRVEERIDAIIRDPGADAPPSARQKLGDLYASYLDTVGLARLGVAPIRADLDRIQAIADYDGVARWMARPRSHTIVGPYVFVDMGDPSRNLLHLDQQSLGPRVLGLPSKSYYSSEDAPYPEHRAGYLSYIQETLRRAGIDDSERRAREILALESRLAQTQWDARQLRDRKLNYHPMPRANLATYAPGFPWDTFLDAVGVGDVTEIVLNTDTAIRGSAAIFADTPVETWKSYLLFHWIHNHAEFLAPSFDRAAFEFYGRQLYGQTTRRDRERRAIQFVNQQLGDLVGATYVKRYFPPGYREEMATLARYMRRAFAERVAAAEWLDDATRAAALRKMDGMILRFGYGDRMRDYADVVIDRSDLIGNAQRLAEAEWVFGRSHLARPTSEWGWFMSPQTVDAMYTPQLNMVTFPAGMLQPPMFDPFADAAVNFGAIGAVLGHEIGHGFDDQGARFDERGMLRDWWTGETREAFVDRTKVLVDQFSQYSPIDGLSLDGARGLGENIGDLTGVAVAHHAYHLYVQDELQGSSPEIGGYSGDQRFFLAWAQLWRSLETEASLRRSVQEAQHSPPRYRVNGIVRNIDHWYEAFDVTPASRLYLAPSARVKLW